MCGAGTPAREFVRTVPVGITDLAEGRSPLGQPLADFFGGDSLASFGIPNTFVNGGESFLVFIIENRSRIFKTAVSSGGEEVSSHSV